MRHGQGMSPPCSLQRVSDHVWWFTPEARRDRPSLAAVVGERETVLLDLGASVRHHDEFVAALDGVGVRRAARAVLTHWHWDHVFGIGAFAGEVIAHRQTAAGLARMRMQDYSDAGLAAQVVEGLECAFTRDHMGLELSEAERRALVLRVPEVLVDDALRLDLGGVTCEVRHVGGDHTADAMVVFVPEDRALFLGDCLCDDMFVTPQRLTREKLLPLIARLEGFGAEIGIEGHRDGPISGEELSDSFRFIRDAYAVLARGGAEHAKAELAGRYPTKLVEEWLPAILAGWRG